MASEYVGGSNGVCPSYSTSWSMNADPEVCSRFFVRVVAILLSSSSFTSIALPVLDIFTDRLEVSSSRQHQYIYMIHEA